MTCIVALRENGVIYMGSDSICVSSYSKTIGREPKVFQRGAMLFGTCGSVRMRNLLQYQFAIPVYTGNNPMNYLVNDFIDALRECFKTGGVAKEKGGREKGGRFLLGFQGELFFIDYEYDLGTTTDPYYAIGSADEVAFGSLHTTAHMGIAPLQRLELALKAAEYHTTDVAGPFRFITSQPGENT